MLEIVYFSAVPFVRIAMKMLSCGANWSDSGPVIDTTPVDTTIARIDASNAADESRLTGPLGDEFTAADSIFLAIHANGTAEKYTISSKWFYPDGEVITENSQIVNGAGPTATIFSMSKPDGWEPGTYKVEFSINGKLQQTKTFTVR